MGTGELSQQPDKKAGGGIWDGLALHPRGISNTPSWPDKTPGASPPSLFLA